MRLVLRLMVCFQCNMLVFDVLNNFPADIRNLFVIANVHCFDLCAFVFNFYFIVVKNVSLYCCIKVFLLVFLIQNVIITNLCNLPLLLNKIEY